MYSESEVMVAVLAVGLAPIFIWTLRQLDMRDKGYIGLALVAIALSYAATILEGFWFYDFFNTIEHGLEPVVAVSFALYAVRFFRRSVLREGGKHR